MAGNMRIESRGLKDFLDSTRWKHFDNGYSDLKIMLERNLSVSSIAKLFGVDWRTANKWVEIYRKETSNGQSSKNS